MLKSALSAHVNPEPGEGHRGSEERDQESRRDNCGQGATNHGSQEKWNRVGET